MNSLLTTIRNAFSEKEQAISQTYEGLVEALVEGQPVEHEAAVIVLQNSHKSPEDLEQDVARRQQRLEAAAALEDHPVAREESSQLHDAIVALDEQLRTEIQKLHAKFQRRRASIDQDLAAVRERINAGTRGRQLLVRTADPELKSQLESVRRSLVEARDHLKICEREVIAQDRALERARTDSESGRAINIEGYEKVLKERQTREAEAKQMLSELQADFEAAEQALLIP